jgi:hypothetical protein
LYVLPFILAVFWIPWLVYRLNTLQNASYVLQRDQLQMHWGLRTEIIPMNSILWVHPATDLEIPLRYPWLGWPGAILGARILSDGRRVEFLASQRRGLLLVACPSQIFAISPDNLNAFLQAYQRLSELGSLSVSQPVSIYPTFLLARIWAARSARTLLIVGFILSTGLLIWGGLTAAKLDQVSLGFQPNGEPRLPIPGIRLMLLPVLNLVFTFANTFLGAFFYRREENRPLAYLLWFTMVLVAVLFGVAIYIILKIS